MLPPALALTFLWLAAANSQHPLISPGHVFAPFAEKHTAISSHGHADPLEPDTDVGTDTATDIHAHTMIQPEIATPGDQTSSWKKYYSGRRSALRHVM